MSVKGQNNKGACYTNFDNECHMIFDITNGNFLDALLMNKFTNLVTHDG